MPKSPKVDTSDLVRGWKDRDWATNVQRERLGVYALGTTANLPGGGAREKWMTEVDSIENKKHRNTIVPAPLEIEPNTN